MGAIEILTLERFMFTIHYYFRAHAGKWHFYCLNPTLSALFTAQMLAIGWILVLCHTQESHHRQPLGPFAVTLKRPERLVCGGDLGGNGNDNVNDLPEPIHQHPELS